MELLATSLGLPHVSQASVKTVTCHKVVAVPRARSGCSIRGKKRGLLVQDLCNCCCVCVCVGVQNPVSHGSAYWPPGQPGHGGGSRAWHLHLLLVLAHTAAL